MTDSFKNSIKSTCPSAFYIEVYKKEKVKCDIYIYIYRRKNWHQFSLKIQIFLLRTLKSLTESNAGHIKFPLLEELLVLFTSLPASPGSNGRLMKFVLPH